MDRRSWLWRKKSSERSPGETESSGSMSSHSERYSDDQDTSRASPNHNTQSPEVTSKAAVTSEELNDNLNILREKLSAALINISAKEDLVKQHAKVAEEAVSGWEKAENESAAFKQQLEVAVQRNSALEDRLGHLDGALKECLRKLRQAREEQEQKIQEAVVKRTCELESSKFELEKQLDELQTQLEAAKAGDAPLVNPDILMKLEASEKQNSALKHELFARFEELEMRTLERDLSTETAETASKQHLESIKKVAKLEAECRKLRAMARKASSANDHKSVTASSVYIESFTDSQSDSGERLLSLESDNHKVSALELNGCEPSCSDSWASALIAELDQFKNENAVNKTPNTSSLDIDLMEDFLEMERLAALPESGKNSAKPGVTVNQHNSEDCQHREDLEAMVERVKELEMKLEKVKAEKAGLELALAEIQEQLNMSDDHLREAKEELVELHRQLDFTNESKQATEAKMKIAVAKKEAVESQLIMKEAQVKAAVAKKEVVESELIVKDAEVQTLHAKVASLETEVKEERALSAEITAKCRKMEDELSTKRQEAELRKAANSNGESKIKQEKELAAAAGKLAECQQTIASLGRQLKSLATLEDFMIDSDHPSNDELWKSPSSSNFVPKDRNTEQVKTNPIEVSPQSSSSSSSSSVNHVVTSDKSRNGFGKLFSRSKSAMRLETQ